MAAVDPTPEYAGGIGEAPLDYVIREESTTGHNCVIQASEYVLYVQTPDWNIARHDGFTAPQHAEEYFKDTYGNESP